jgi:hypothetical protein
LAWWFSRLSRDIGAVVDATYFSGAVADEAAHAATKKAIKARRN